MQVRPLDGEHAVHRLHQNIVLIKRVDLHHAGDLTLPALFHAESMLSYARAVSDASAPAFHIDHALLPIQVLPIVYGESRLYMYRNSSFASSFLTVSCTSRISTFVSLLPNWIVRMSPTLTFADALAGLSLMSTRPASHASFATVRRLMMRDTFKNLSSLILILP